MTFPKTCIQFIFQYLLLVCPKNVKSLKKKIIKKITNIEEDCSDEQETKATENSMETREKLFTTESE